MKFGWKENAISDSKRVFRRLRVNLVTVRILKVKKILKFEFVKLTFSARQALTFSWISAQGPAWLTSVIFLKIRKKICFCDWLRWEVSRKFLQELLKQSRRHKKGRDWLGSRTVGELRLTAKNKRLSANQMTSNWSDLKWGHSGSQPNSLRTRKTTIIHSTYPDLQKLA